MTATREYTPATTTETSSSLLVVVDAPPAVQEWADRYGRTLAEALGHQDHPHSTGTVVITLSQFWRMVEASVRNDSDTGPWSIATSGLPSFPEDLANPDVGNWLHTACHVSGICR